jgi:hypothetical protein
MLMASDEVDLVVPDFGRRRTRRLWVFAVFLAAASQPRISGSPYLARDAHLR